METDDSLLETGLLQRNNCQYWVLKLPVVPIKLMMVFEMEVNWNASDCKQKLMTDCWIDLVLKGKKCLMRNFWCFEYRLTTDTSDVSAILFPYVGDASEKLQKLVGVVLYPANHDLVWATVLLSSWMRQVCVFSQLHLLSWPKVTVLARTLSCMHTH